MMKRWHYIAIAIAAVPVAAWAFWGPGGMGSGGKVGAGDVGVTSVVLTAKVEAEQDENIFINSVLIAYNGGAGTVFATQAVNSAVEYTFLTVDESDMTGASEQTNCTVTSDDWPFYGGNITVTVTNVTPGSFTCTISTGEA